MSISRDQQLVKMAKQISINIGARLSPEAAAARTVDHINRFWTADMKRRFVQQVSLDPVNASETLLIIAENVGDVS
mgnify:CR=1 FL=1